MSDPQSPDNLDHLQQYKQLVYPTVVEGKQFTNVLLIDRSVQEYQQFIDSANADTFPIVYSVMSSKTDLLELLKTTFTSISRIGIVSHSYSSGDAITFLDNEKLFIPNEVNANQQFITDVIKEFQIKNIDYLACNTLNFPNWVNYYNNITQDTGVTVGASNDKTGNIKYGGDWTMESTSENVELIYFSKNIEYYQYLLVVFTQNNITYTTSGSNCSVTGSTAGLAGAITIPSSVTDSGITYTVTSIGEEAFYGCTGLTSVTIPSSVTSIGTYAFYGCTGLTSITIPSRITSIGQSAFSGCTGLTSVTIQSGVTSIGTYAFYRCTGLTSITIPGSVASIGSNTFDRCSRLTSVTIQNGVKSIGSYAFQNCSGITSITIPFSVTSIVYGAFIRCTGLTSVTIPSSVKSIGASAFFGCTGLTSVTIESGVTSIGDTMFQGCTRLTSVTIPSSVTSIGPYAFETCTGLTSVTIPGSVTSIGNYAFQSCTGLTSVTIPSSVTSIGTYAFYGCTGLTSVTIPSSVTSIGTYAFYGCTGLTSVTIPSSVTSIGIHAFYKCSSLTRSNIIIPQTLQLNAYQFYIDPLVKILIIPSHVTSIANNQFRDCTTLTSVIIPSSVTSIGTAVFYNCTGLTSITIQSGVTSIANYTFQSCTGLTSITIPGSVTSIGSSAFQGCTSLKSITIPSSVTSIGTYVFYNCTGLTSITIPSSVTSIGIQVFQLCSNLRSIIFINPNSLTNVGNNIFLNDPSMNVTFYNTADNAALSLYVKNNLLGKFPAGSNYENYISGIPPSPTITSISPTRGHFGTPVTITGTNFIPSMTTSVTFDGIDATNITIDSSSSITCIAPNHANGAVNVVVMNSIGTTTLTNGFTYANPTITTVSPSRGHLGTPVTITGTNFDASSNVTFDGILATNIVLVSETSITCIAPSHANGVIDVVVNSYGYTTTLTNGFTYANPTITTVSPFTGKLGSLITITGTNFDGSESVTFDGINATNVSLVSATKITCTAPSHANGLVDVVVAGIVTSQNAFKYINPISNICFPANTPIMCNQGNIPIEKLNPEIHTIRGKKIVGITKTVSQDKYLICFEKDALQENIPSKRTIITENHKIFYKGEMKKAGLFLNDYEKVRKVKYTGEVLYNVLLEEHEKMMVNNVICETLDPKNTIAKLYKTLVNLNEKQQNEVISHFNEYVIEKNIYKKSNKK